MSDSQQPSMHGWDRGEDRGVSPVIGIVLMVGVTVVVASVVGATAITMSERFDPNADASVTVETGHDVTITAMGDGTERVICVSENGTETASADTVGSSLDCSAGDNVVAVGVEGTDDRTIRTGV